MSRDFSPAVRPTMIFIGVTTRSSSINAVFPRWAARLGLGEVELRGWDFPLRDSAVNYREALAFLKHDPLTLGALVTTHKIDVYSACRDQFDSTDGLTEALGEISSIYKRAGRLHGRTVDPITNRLALDTLLPGGYWSSGGEALILGAGGAGVALAYNLNDPTRSDARPARVHVVDRSAERLAHLRRLHARWPAARPLVCHQVSHPVESDAVLAALPPASLIANATGAGKDTPGSPLTDAAVFPSRSVVWEFNYRGDLAFLAQARRQSPSRALLVVDGWNYFLHGWTRVMADVFDREIPTTGPLFDELGRLAAATR